MRGGFRAKPRAMCPKRVRMVHFRKMGDFMGCDIVQHFRRCHNQPPGKHQVALAGAAAPSTTGVAQRDPAMLVAQSCGIARYGIGQSFPRYGDQKRLDPDANASVIRHPQDATIKPSGATWTGLNRTVGAKNREHTADFRAPFWWGSGDMIAQPSLTRMKEI